MSSSDAKAIVQRGTTAKQRKMILIPVVIYLNPRHDQTHKLLPTEMNLVANDIVTKQIIED